MKMASTVDTDILVQFNGVTISLGEGIFKTAQPKISKALIEKGVKSHVASQYVSQVKRTKSQPYKFLVRNLWTLPKIQEAIPEGLPTKPKSFGTAKSTAFGLFKLLADLSREEDVAKIVSDLPMSGKSNPVKIFLAFQKSDKSSDSSIHDKILSKLREALHTNIQGYCSFEKYILEANKQDSSAFYDYVIELYITGGDLQKKALIIEEIINESKNQWKNSFYGFFEDFAEAMI